MRSSTCIAPRKGYFPARRVPVFPSLTLPKTVSYSGDQSLFYHFSSPNARACRLWRPYVVMLGGLEVGFIALLYCFDSCACQLRWVILRDNGAHVVSRVCESGMEWFAVWNMPSFRTATVARGRLWRLLVCWILRLLVSASFSCCRGTRNGSCA